MDIQAYISSGIIEAYVMGLATEEEQQILECVQQHNAEVRQAVLEARQTLEAYTEQIAETPPPHLKAAIWSAIQEDEQSDTLVKTSEPEVPESPASHTLSDHTDIAHPAKRFSFQPLAIAASILLIISMGALGYMARQQDKIEQQLAALQQEHQETNLAYTRLQQKWDMSSNPEMKTVTLTGVPQHPGMKAMVYMDSKTNQTYLSLENLPPAPKDHQYQLWAIVDGKPVDAGMYDEASGASVQKMYIIANAQAFAITLEKAGGSPTPTMEQMYAMGKI